MEIWRIRMRLRFFVRRKLRQILRKIRGGAEDAVFWTRELFHGDPVGLAVDTPRGAGLKWWTVGVLRAAGLTMTFYNPVRFLREARQRKAWWDAKTQGQRHWVIEEQGRLMEKLIGACDKLHDSLSQEIEKLS